jgi:TIR domain
MATTMAKIFISYDRASKDIVEQVVEDLTDDDHAIWFDQHLTGGQNWWDNILSEIRQCEIFVAALTPASLESRACQRELKYATPPAAEKT